MTFLNDMPNFVSIEKKKKISKFDFSYHRNKAQPLVLRILRRSFSKNTQ